MNIGTINASYPYIKTQKEKEKEQRVKPTFESTFNKEKQKQERRDK